MRDQSTRSIAARVSIVLALSAGMAMLSAGSASALGLPPLPALPPPVSTVVVAVTAPLAPPAAAPAPATAPAPSISILPVNVVVTVPIIASAPVPASPLPPMAGTPAPAPLLSALIEVSTGVKSGLNQIGAALAPTPLAPVAPNGNPAGLANVVVQASPLASACVQATGTGTALLNIDLIALGIDIGSPLVQTFPGFLEHCPAGTIPAPGNGSTTAGSTIVGVDGNVGDLVGACVRVTTSVVPVQSTILVLSEDIIATLTEAGLPLEQLIVPCPGVTTTPPGDGGGGGGGSDDGSDDGTGGAGNGGSGNGGTGSEAGSGFPAAAGSLPFTGAEIGALMALAAALMAAGLLMVRKARANQWAVRI